jgi:hypothetical protein
MSADAPPLYARDTREGVDEFYADCRKMSIPGVQFVAELPAAYSRANECRRCDSDTNPRFLIQHESREHGQIRAEFCPAHAAELVRNLGGRPSGTRIDDRQDGDTWQATLGAAKRAERDAEVNS